jgi:hypothetical protein
MYIKDTQNYIELEIKTSFQHNLSIQPIFTKTPTTTQFTPQTHNYEHPQYESSTTTSHNNNNNNNNIN